MLLREFTDEQIEALSDVQLDQYINSAIKTLNNDLAKLRQEVKNRSRQVDQIERSIQRQENMMSRSERKIGTSTHNAGTAKTWGTMEGGSRAQKVLFAKTLRNQLNNKTRTVAGIQKAEDMRRFTFERKLRVRLTDSEYDELIRRLANAEGTNYDSDQIMEDFQDEVFDAREEGTTLDNLDEFDELENFGNLFSVAKVGAVDKKLGVEVPKLSQLLGKFGIEDDLSEYLPIERVSTLGRYAQYGIEGIDEQVRYLIGSRTTYNKAIKNADWLDSDERGEISNIDLTESEAFKLGTKLDGVSEKRAAEIYAKFIVDKLERGGLL